MIRGVVDCGPDFVAQTTPQPSRPARLVPHRSGSHIGLDATRKNTVHDVICAGMYRACSTWQYEVVGHLVEQRLKGRRLGYVTGDGYSRARWEESRCRRWSGGEVRSLARAQVA